MYAITKLTCDRQFERGAWRRRAIGSARYHTKLFAVYICSCSGGAKSCRCSRLKPTASHVSFPAPRHHVPVNRMPHVLTSEQQRDLLATVWPADPRRRRACSGIWLSQVKSLIPLSLLSERRPTPPPPLPGSLPGHGRPPLLFSCGTDCGSPPPPPALQRSMWPSCSCSSRDAVGCLHCCR